MTTPPPLIPKALKPGTTISFISPSSRLNEALPTPLSRATEFFSRKGYTIKTIYSPLPSSPSVTFLQKTHHIVSELHSAFLDPRITCILTTIGGTEASEILRYIDYNLIRQNPKIFVGYSDITHLIYAFYTQAGLRSFYGPCVFTEFAEWPEPDPFTTGHFFRALSGKDGGGEGITGKQIPMSRMFTQIEVPFLKDPIEENEKSEELREMLPTPVSRFIRPGDAEGPFLGGCLRKLVSLSGTPFFSASMHKGSIFFFEISSGEYGTPMPLARVRSDVMDLINAGVWDGIVGLVVGRTLGYGEEMNRELEGMVGELIDAVRGGREVPVLIGVDVGHTSPMLTLPFGARARLDSGKNEFMFLEEGVV